MLIKFSSIVFVFLLSISCSGYKVVKNESNFKKYGIHSISVPMFFNKSTLPDISSRFTNSFTQELYSIPDLEVKSPNSKTNDAYLVGVVRSAPSESGTVIRGGLAAKIKDLAPNRGEGNDNLLPITNIIRLKVDLFLVRRSADSESLISKLRSKMHPSLLESHPSIVLKQTIPISVNVNREIYDDDFVINSTQNYGILNKVISAEAKKAAITFKQSINYVF